MTLYSKTWIIAIAALLALTCQAQQLRPEDQQWLQNQRDKIANLNRVQQDYYEQYVQPLEQKVEGAKTYDVNDPKLKADIAKYDELQASKAAKEKEVAKLQRERDAAQTRLDAAKASLDNDKLRSYLNKLQKEPCNTAAIDELNEFLNSNDYLEIDDYNKGLITLLHNYPKMTDELRASLEAIEKDMDRLDWDLNNDRSGEVLQIYKDALSHSSYIKQYFGTRNSILYLDKIVDELKAYADNGFAIGSQTKFEALKKKLTPVNSIPKNSPLTTILSDWKTIRKNESLIESNNSDLQHINKDIAPLQSKIDKVNNANGNFNELDKKRYDETEKWYDRREDRDKALIEACEYCLSLPADKDTLTMQLIAQVKQLTDTTRNAPVFKSYKERLAKYHELMDHYKEYTDEIGEFLTGYSGNAKTNKALPSDVKTEITNKFYDLKYYNYYRNRNEKKAVHSKHLDKIFADFERLLSANFVNCWSNYKKLGLRLRGLDQQASSSKQSTSEK